MNFLATYWWVFLILMFFCYALVMANQLKRMKRIVSLDGEGFGMFKGMFSLFLFGLVGSLSGVLFVIGGIVAIIRAVK